jgi:Protein of unknown function (DUF998)
MVRKLLVICGIAASLLYVAVNILGAMRWVGYSSTSQTFSELFAIGAPMRALVVPPLVIYALLIYAFGVGVWMSARQKRALRFTAVGLIGKEVLGVAATVFFPMHLRGTLAAGQLPLTDTMHIVLTGVGLLFMLLAIVSAAIALGKGFRLYTIVTILIFVLGATLAFLNAPQIAVNQPTPWAGVTERMNTFAYTLWVVVLAIALLRSRMTQPQNNLAGKSDSGRVGSDPRHAV